MCTAIPHCWGECGCWNLYYYDPWLKKEGKNPSTLDSKEPTGDFQQFLMGQDRCAVLKLSFPEKAERLYSKAESDAKERLQGCRRLTGQVDFSVPAPLTLASGRWKSNWSIDWIKETACFSAHVEGASATCGAGRGYRTAPSKDLTFG